jgi:hypothetical protein
VQEDINNRLKNIFFEFDRICKEKGIFYNIVADYEMIQNYFVKDKSKSGELYTDLLPIVEKNHIIMKRLDKSNGCLFCFEVEAIQDDGHWELWKPGKIISPLPEKDAKRVRKGQTMYQKLHSLEGLLPETQYKPPTTKLLRQQAAFPSAITKQATKSFGGITPLDYEKKTIRENLNAKYNLFWYTVGWISPQGKLYPNTSMERSHNHSIERISGQYKDTPSAMKAGWVRYHNGNDHLYLHAHNLESSWSVIQKALEPYYEKNKGRTVVIDDAGITHWGIPFSTMVFGNYTDLREEIIKEEGTAIVPKSIHTILKSAECPYCGEIQPSIYPAKIGYCNSCKKPMTYPNSPHIPMQEPGTNSIATQSAQRSNASGEKKEMQPFNMRQNAFDLPLFPSYERGDIPNYRKPEEGTPDTTVVIPDDEASKERLDPMQAFAKGEANHIGPVGPMGMRGRAAPEKDKVAGPQSPAPSNVAHQGYWSQPVKNIVYRRHNFMPLLKQALK